MPTGISFNKRIIQEAGACMRLGFFRVRDRDGQSSDKLSAADEIRLLYGIKVGEKAREQFPGGKLVQAKTFSRALTETKATLQGGDKIIFEAAFAVDGIGIKVDVLRRHDKNTFDLIEVKSGTDPAKYYEDVAVQILVLRKIGIQAQPFLMILDKYANIKSKSLFQLIDCADEVDEIMPEIEERVEALRRTVLVGNTPEVPFTRACRDCDYFGACLPKLPEHHVFTLYRGGKKIDELLVAGIRSLKKLPADFQLSDQQSVQVGAIKSGKLWKSAKLSKTLSGGIKYPLFFLDFEAAADPIPEFKNQHPYDLLPFQWSCHIQNAPSADPKHREFLFDKAGDPRPAFAESLLECLGSAGTIVMYTPYEAQVIKAMAIVLPSCREKLLALIPRLWDLCDVIRKNFYHPDFNGSYSIKNVLPVLVPSLSYDNMEVGEGMAAVLAYYRLIAGKLPLAEHKVLSAALREYCKLDTLAMVKVFQALGRAQ